MSFGDDAADGVWRPLPDDLPADLESEARILLLIADEGNRRQIQATLERQYEVVTASGDSAPEAGFDLMIADGPALHRWKDTIAEIKRRGQPVFLPVMLVLPRSDLHRRIDSLLSIIDEFVATPIDLSEFSQRIALLLRARKQALEQQQQLVQIVNYDQPTGLPNRNLFRERLRTAMAAAKRHGGEIYAFVIQTPLENVIETYGQGGLNSAAVGCAERFRELLGDGVYLARLGGTGWGVVMEAGTSLQAVFDTCAWLGRFDDKPVAVDGQSVYVKTRIGIATFPEDASNPDDLFDAAVAACAQATHGKPVFYGEARQESAHHYLRAEAGLRNALAERQLELWLQPKMRLADGRVTGAEALIRWRLPSGELVPPGEFIPVAESSGFIQDITRWVIEEACRVVDHLRRTVRDFQDAQISVNITPADITRSGFSQWVSEMCERYGLSTAALGLELTETMICEMDARTVGLLATLRDSGFTIDIDDFGTGYSSLSYLHRMPASSIKLDKTFVDGIPGDAASETLTKAIIHLAQEFGLRIIAEGIENQEQIEYLRKEGVDLAQGYHLARPMPLSEFKAWMEQPSPGVV